MPGGSWRTGDTSLPSEDWVTSEMPSLTLSVQNSHRPSNEKDNRRTEEQHQVDSLDTALPHPAADARQDLSTSLIHSSSRPQHPPEEDSSTGDQNVGKVRAAFTTLKNIWKSWLITTWTKVHLLSSNIKSMDGAETHQLRPGHLLMSSAPGGDIGLNGKKWILGWLADFLKSSKSRYLPHQKSKIWIRKEKNKING